MRCVCICQQTLKTTLVQSQLLGSHCFIPVTPLLLRINGHNPPYILECARHIHTHQLTHKLLRNLCLTRHSDSRTPCIYTPETPRPASFSLTPLSLHLSTLQQDKEKYERGCVWERETAGLIFGQMVGGNLMSFTFSVISEKSF